MNTFLQLDLGRHFEFLSVFASDEFVGFAIIVATRVTLPASIKLERATQGPFFFGEVGVPITQVLTEAFIGLEYMAIVVGLVLDRLVGYLLAGFVISIGLELLSRGHISCF